jgi:hypothetical protein
MERGEWYSSNNNKTAETKNAEAIIRSWSKNGQMRASERGMHQNRSRTNLTDRSEATSQRHVLSSSSSECVCARSDLFSRSIHTPKKRHKFNSHQSEIFTHTCVCWLLDGWLAGGGCLGNGLFCSGNVMLSKCTASQLHEAERSRDLMIFP